MLALAVTGGIHQAGSVGREVASRLLGVPELVASLAGSRKPKQLRLRIVILRDERGDPVLPASGLDEALAETRRVLEREAATRVIPADGALVTTAEERAPTNALDSPCRNSGLWRTDLGAAGPYFRRLSIRGAIGRGAPVTVFVVRDVVGKCGCSLGPLGDYVTIDPSGLGGTARRILVHELGHSCGLRHKSDPDNVMRARGQGERLTRWQRAVLRSSRHVTYL
jgi:hypothetical protein